MKNELPARFLLKHRERLAYSAMINTLIMKKSALICVLVSLFAALALFSGCASSDKYAAKDFNMLGIVRVTPESYERINNATFALHTDEVVARRNVSGDNVQFLWGLVTIADY